MHSWYGSPVGIETRTSAEKVLGAPPHGRLQRSLSFYTTQTSTSVTSASPARGRSSLPHPWPTDFTLEASELPALDLWFAPPLLSSCLLQSCYMIITHGTQHDHTSSSELNRNMFAGALHDNLCGRSRG